MKIEDMMLLIVLGVIILVVLIYIICFIKDHIHFKPKEKVDRTREEEDYINNSIYYTANLPIMTAQELIEASKDYSDEYTNMTWKVIQNKIMEAEKKGEHEVYITSGTYCVIPYKHLVDTLTKQGYKFRSITEERFTKRAYDLGYMMIIDWSKVKLSKKNTD